MKKYLSQPVRGIDDMPFNQSISFQHCAALAAMLMFSSAACAQEKKKPMPKPPRAELLKTFDAEFVSITPGKGKFPASFEMGSSDGPAAERPVHKVTPAHGFSMAKYEVPQDLYEAVMGNNPSVWGGPRNSVEMVTWLDAVRFCRTATRQMRAAGLIEADEEIRLPSEAEWEYCCRGGTTTAYSFGGDATKEGDGTDPKKPHEASRLDPYGWHTGNAAGNDPPVGALKPNAWGLYDMHGYLWEYTADAWHADYQNAPADGSAWDAQQRFVHRVVRGGSWRDRYEQLRSSTRMPAFDHVRSDAIGFRCVKAKVE